MVPARRLRKGWMMASRTFLPRRQRGDALQTRRHLRRIEHLLLGATAELRLLRQALVPTHQLFAGTNADEVLPASRVLRAAVAERTQHEPAELAATTGRKGVRSRAASPAGSRTVAGRVLARLLDTPGVFVHVEQLLVAGGKERPLAARALRVHIHQLRAALAGLGEDDVIQTGHKSYALRADCAAQARRMLGNA